MVTNISSVITVIIAIATGIFVLYKSPQKTGNRLFFLFSIGSALFFLSHIIGANMSDPLISRNVFRFNMVTIFIPIFILHWVSALLNRLKQEKNILLALYITATALCVFYLVSPDSFMHASAPKLYFPNFYVPGKFYFLGDFIFYSTIVYTFFQMFRSYKIEDVILQRRIRYVFVGLTGGLIASSTPALLLYGISIDPIFLSLTGFFYIMMAYGLIKENLLGINIIAKKTFFYTIFICIFGFIIAGADYLNSYLISEVSNFPRWIIPLLSAVTIFFISIIMWRRLKEVDILKYEFINIVTHKFRTPLTYIRWSLETLKKLPLNNEGKDSVKNIEIAKNKLSELTELLVETARDEDSGFEYYGEKIQLSDAVESEIGKLKDQLPANNIYFKMPAKAESPLVLVDRRRFGFVIQTLIENAVTYARNSGRVEVTVRKEPKWGVVEVRDWGVGIEPNELPFIFNRFYRSQEATRINTEGMGIGLFVSKTIVNRFGGKIYVKSEGRGKGSCFSVFLPLIK